jgi:hypothetical protein
MSYQIVVLVSWVAALWGIVSASRQQSSAFESIGRAKWKWVVINVVGLIPYLGLITAGIYAFLVFRQLPTRRWNIRQQFNPGGSRQARSANPSGYSRQPGAPAPQADFAANVFQPAPAQTVPCSACGASGRVGNDQACFPCGGKGYV